MPSFWKKMKQTRLNPKLGLVALILAGLPLLGIYGQSLEDSRRDVLNFGLEKDIVALVNELKVEENHAYDQEIFSLFDQFDGKTFRETILSYAALSESEGLEGPAAALFDDIDLMENSTLFLALDYLIAVDYRDIIPRLMELIEDENQALAVGSIRAIGRFKAQEQAEALYTFYEEESLEENYTSDLIWAIGELEYQDAREEFAEVLEDDSVSALWRERAAEALGKIGGPEAKEALVRNLATDNVRLGGEILKALSQFPLTEDIQQEVMAKLRANDPAFRSAALDFVIEQPIPGAWDIIAYRMDNDPDNKVRNKSLKALEAIDQNRFRGVIRNILLEKSDKNFLLWKTALTLAREDYRDIYGDFLPGFLLEEGQKSVSTLLDEAIGQMVNWPGTDPPPWFGNVLSTSNSKILNAAMKMIQRKKWMVFIPRVTQLRSHANPIVRANARTTLTILEPDEEGDDAGRD
jgi:hypothetical protein